MKKTDPKFPPIEFGKRDDDHGKPTIIQRLFSWMERQVPVLDPPQIGGNVPMMIARRRNARIFMEINHAGIDAPSTPGNSKPVRPGMKEFASLNQARREAMPGETVRINGYNVVVPPSPVATPPGYGRVLPTLSPMPSHKQEEAIMQAIQDALNHGDCTGTDILRGYQVAGVMIILALDRAGFTVAKK